MTELPRGGSAPGSLINVLEDEEDADSLSESDSDDDNIIGYAGESDNNENEDGTKETEEMDAHSDAENLFVKTRSGRMAGSWHCSFLKSKHISLHLQMDKNAEYKSLTYVRLSKLYDGNAH